MADDRDSPEATAERALERWVARFHYSPAQRIGDWGKELIRAERRRAVRKVRRILGHGRMVDFTVDAILGPRRKGLTGQEVRCGKVPHWKRRGRWRP